MLINTPISLGELVDKISILIIKQKNITDETKLDHVKKELDFLQKTLMNYFYKNWGLVDLKKTSATSQKVQKLIA